MVAVFFTTSASSTPASWRLVVEYGAADGDPAENPPGDGGGCALSIPSCRNAFIAKSSVKLASSRSTDRNDMGRLNCTTLAPSMFTPGAIASVSALCTVAWYSDRKSTRLNSSHANISYAVFCLKKKNKSVSTSNYDNRQGVVPLKRLNAGPVNCLYGSALSLLPEGRTL